MKSKLARVALRTSMIYAVFAIVWTSFSHWMLVAFVPDPAVLTRLAIYNDWAFGTVTVLLLYAMLRGQLRHLEREATERKQAEEKLRESEAKFRALTEESLTGVYLIQGDRFQYVNAAEARIMGYTPQELLALPSVLETVAEEDRPRVAENFRRRLAGEIKTLHYEFILVRKDGERRLVEVTGAATTFAGRPAVLGTLQDITERKQAEEALCNSERLLRLVMDLVPHFIFVKDKESRHLLVNRACAEATNLTVEQMVGLSDLDMAPGSGQAEGFMKADQEVIASGQPKFSEEKLIDAKGQTRFLQTTKIPFPSSTITFPVPGNGKPAILGVSVDITALKEAEAALRQKQEQLVEAMRIARLARWEYDVLADRFTFNDQFYSILRTTAEREGGYTMSSAEYAKRFVHPDDRAMVKEESQKSLVTNDPNFTQQLDHRIIYGDGQVGYFSVRVRIEKDAQGRTVKTHGVNMDITERKQAEVQLAESRNYLAKIINSIADPLFVKDRKHRWVLLNDAYCEFMGHKREELLGKSDCDFFPKHEADVFWAKDEVVFTTGLENINEEEFTDSKGKVHTIMTKKALYTDEKGEKFIVGIIRDITERKQAEEANVRLATAVKQAVEAIVITDPNGTILYVNPAFERITGYTSSEVIGRNPRILKSGKHDAAFYRQMWDALPQGKVWSGRVINKKKNGSLYEEEMSISPVFDSAGKITNYVAVKRDVTQEVALATQLRQAQKMEIIGQLAGGVAHDFNNILTVIQGNASLLLNPELKPAEKTECSQQIVQAAQRAAGLTRQLLVFSRKQTIQLTHVSLNEIVAQMTKMLRRVLGENIALQSNYAANLPPIHGDAGMIEQVLMNLVVNARDAMPKGGSLTISTGVQTVDKEQAAQSPGAAPGLHVWLAVSDTGSGIAPENLPRIFEPFFTTKEVGKGTGLGLATAYGIIQQHHGWISVTSETNKGTTFRIYFPAVVNAEPEKKAELPVA
jgi:PAS domain S-box-containing protein